MLDQLDTLSKQRLSQSFRDDTLELILLPTEKCNFRCTYCYEDFLQGKMPGPVIRGVKSLISHRARSLRHLHVSWFGGEPLLQKELCLDVIEHAHRVCGEHGASFSGGFTTNGSRLTVDLVRTLAHLNSASFQVSLDGDQEIHDTTRKAANGKGTFDLIWKNLCSLGGTNIPFSITLRLHVSPYNANSLESLLNRIKDEFRGDERFKIFFHKISALGGEGSSRVTSIGKEEYAATIGRLKGIIPAKRDTYSENDLVDNKYICYAARPNSLLIRASGSIGKCTVAFEDDRNNLGRINEDGTLSIDRRKLGIWMEPFRTLDWKLLACPNARLSHLEREYDARHAKPVISSVLTTT